MGLIDLVNTYAEVALFDGLVGLTLFVGFILIALLKNLSVSEEGISV